MLSLNDIYDVYRLNPQESGVVDHHLAGRLLIHDGTLEVLADYFGFLASLPNGRMDEHTAAAVAALMRSPYFILTSCGDRAVRGEISSRANHPSRDWPPL